MSKIVDGIKYGWGLAVEGYEVCVAQIEAHPRVAFVVIVAQFFALVL